MSDPSYPSRASDRPPTHPGSLLKDDVLPALGRPKAEIARLLGISRQTLHALLGERQSVTPETALRLGKLCGNGPVLWLNMQRQHDLWHVERAMADELAGIPTLTTA